MFDTQNMEPPNAIYRDLGPVDQVALQKHRVLQEYQELVYQKQKVLNDAFRKSELKYREEYKQRPDGEEMQALKARRLILDKEIALVRHTRHPNKFDVKGQMRTISEKEMYERGYWRVRDQEVSFEDEHQHKEEESQMFWDRAEEIVRKEMKGEGVDLWEGEGIEKKRPRLNVDRITDSIMQLMNSGKGCISDVTISRMPKKKASVVQARDGILR